MEKRTYLTIVPENKKEALRAAGRLVDGDYPLEYDRAQKLWFAKADADLEKIKPWVPENTVTGQHLQTSDNLPPAEEFARVLREAGFILPDNGLPEMDGKKHRLATEGDKPGSKSGTYQGFMDGRPAGWYQNHRSSEGKINWTSSGNHQYDPAEAIKQRALAAQKRWDRELQSQAEYANTGAMLAAQWAKMPMPPETHPYLTRKGVPATEGVRIDKYDNLVIPLRNIDGYIRSLQYIKPDGSKTLKKDAEKTGNFFVVGGELNPRYPFLYAEGYATAASLHLATQLPVIMAVDAGNLVTVSQKLKKRFPEASHIILGEDDFTRKDNKGVIKAREAAFAIGGTYLIPQFTESERSQALAGSASFSDFNDIHQSRGLDAVRDQLAPVLDPLIPEWRDFFKIVTAVSDQIPVRDPPDLSDYADYVQQAPITEPESPLAILSPVLAETPQPEPEHENGFNFSFGRLPGDIAPPEATAQRINLDELLQGLTSRQDGRSWVYALDGQDAFRDYGDRILMASPMASENDPMILAALLSARANQRGAVEITGSEIFIQRSMELIADYQIDVHLKNPLQRAQFEALLKARAENTSPQDGLIIGPTASALAPEPKMPAAHAPSSAPKMSVTERETLQTGLTGKLLDAGKAPYQFDKSKTDSYYVQLRTKDGNKTFWGVELEQALKDSGKQMGTWSNYSFWVRKQSR
jgi:putative DNA primase/helicase